MCSYWTQTLVKGYKPIHARELMRKLFAQDSFFKGVIWIEKDFEGK